MSRRLRPLTLQRLRASARRRLGRLHRRLETQAVALTFDDGPSEYTAQLLDVLAHHQVRATFFLVGRNAHQRPDLVRRLVDDGHAVASHSYSHPYPDSLQPAMLWRDYRDGRRAVEQVSGRRVALFRPPHGHLGGLAWPAAWANARQIWLWTVHADDWEPDLRSEHVTACLRKAMPRDVVVLHDGLEQPIAPSCLDRSTMIEGVDAFLFEARESGVRFATLEPAPVGGSR